MYNNMDFDPTAIDTTAIDMLLAQKKAKELESDKDDSHSPKGVDNSDGVKDNRIAELLSGMLDTYKRKNHDYGDAFHDSIVEFGLVAAVVRMNDKMQRIKTLVKKEAEVKDESIRDTLLDLANYCVMTVAEMDIQKTQEAEK